MKLRHLLVLGLAGLAATSCGSERSDGNEASPNSQAEAGDSEAPKQTIRALLAASPDHRLLVQTLESAGLAEMLDGPIPYTLFAPTDAAFASLSEDARRRLSSPEQRERTIGILSYHIVPGTVTAEDLGRAIDRGPEARAELATVTGDNLALSREGSTLLIGTGDEEKARIVGADRIASNGVVHSVDRVLSPGG